MRTRSLFVFLPFHWKVLVATGCLSHILQRLPLWTPMNMTLCWNFYLTQNMAYSWRRFLMKKKHVSKMRFIVFKVIPIRIIPDTQTRLSDGCSGLMLFPHNALVKHCTRQRSLQFVGMSCAFGVLSAAREYLLLEGPQAWWHPPSGRLTTLYTTITCVTFFCAIFLSVLVVSLMLTMLLEVRVNSVHSIVPHLRDRRKPYVSKECDKEWHEYRELRTSKFITYFLVDAALSQNLGIARSTGDNGRLRQVFRKFRG